MVRRKLVRMGRICRTVLLPMLLVSQLNMTHGNFNEMQDLQLISNYPLPLSLANEADFL